MLVSNYGRYSSGNYGVHTAKVEVNGMVLYYSYKTIVAYQDDADGLVCSRNIWGVTTGKHLNWIVRDKKAMVPYNRFIEMLRAALERNGVDIRL